MRSKSFSRMEGVIVLIAICLMVSSAHAAQVRVGWGAPEFYTDGSRLTVARYDLYYGESRGNYGSPINAGNQTSCTVSDLEPGRTYYFAAKAIDSVGKESGFSEELAFTVPLPQILYFESLTPDSSSPLTRTAGSPAQTVTFTAKAAGGSDRKQYGFWISGPATGYVWQRKQDYSDNNRFSWKIDDRDEGVTRVRARIRDLSTMVEVYGDSAGFTVQVYSSVVAGFDAVPTLGLAPATVRFADRSTGDVRSWQWDFGDGETSRERHPVHTYITPGSYPVTLTVAGPDSSDTVVKTGYIRVVPDTDRDGLSDQEERDRYGTDPGRADTDGDGIGDGEEVSFWGSAWEMDTDNDGIINLLDSDSDQDGFDDGVEIHYRFNPSLAASAPSISDLLVFGLVDVNYAWRRVGLGRSFLDPVVVAVRSSSNDLAPATVRIRNTGPTGFEVRIQEWDYLDDLHAFETVHYLVVERGSFSWADGARVEAGRFETDRTEIKESVSFERPFTKTPVVVTLVTTVNEADAVAGRTGEITTSGFGYFLQEQELNTPVHAVETVSYLAWEPEVGTMDGLHIEVGNLPEGVTEEVHYIPFAETFLTEPVVLAALQTTNSSDTAALCYDDLSLSEVAVKVEEEQSKDLETSHPAERVGYMVFSHAEDVWLPLPGDFDKDGDVDLDDLALLLEDRNKTVEESLCGAPCDLDGDGMITVLDASELVLLCTRPRCAIE